MTADNNRMIASNELGRLRK